MDATITTDYPYFAELRNSSYLTGSSTTMVPPTALIIVMSLNSEGVRLHSKRSIYQKHEEYRDLVAVNGVSRIRFSTSLSDVF